MYDDELVDEELDVDGEKQQSVGSQSKGEVPSFMEDDLPASLLYVPGL